MDNDAQDVLAALEAGKTTFMGYEFLVERGVIVPRPVTEVMIRACLSLLDPAGAYTLVDVGCGTGLIGIVLAHKFPNSRVVCLDISEECVRLTQRNIDKHGLGARACVRQSDMFAAAQDLVGLIDVVVSSPPFISSGRLAKDRAYLLDLEPRAAFDAGPYGISIHQRLAKDSKTVMRPNAGWLVVEVGEGQQAQVLRVLQRAGGYDRFTEFRERTDQYVACVAARLI
ncbi:MAG TPA: HemK family protein methyltransferase [Polyangia bacterium]